MHISRVVIQNYRSLQNVDVPISPGPTVVIGENNVGKSNLIQALRLCLDASLSSAYRSLLKEDIFCRIDQTEPFQVLVGVEFSGFEGNENEEALLVGTGIGNGKARLFYRFRPKRLIREALATDEFDDPLKLDDFSWELAGGGNPAVDLTEITWDVELADIAATPYSLSNLQEYVVAFLPALRDVEADLQQGRRSTLARLIDSLEIPEAEQNALISFVQTANDAIEGTPTIRSVAAAIDASLKNITGAAFSLDVALGLSSPTFQAIVRNLIVLLSNAMVSSFEPRRNGLGMNNILYIAILVEQFRVRAARGKAAGELVLIEEPEAHLHPQLQNTLVQSLLDLPFQCILTTHSTQVTSKVPLSSYVTITGQGNEPPVASVPTQNGALSDKDVRDLERYLDATKSNLLFAQRVMLVEGPAELILLPPLVKTVLGIDLEREGISVVAIHGTHFGPFTRLFAAGAMPKRCAIVADADMNQDQVDAMADDDVPTVEVIAALEGPYVKAFLGASTFEKELCHPGNLAMLEAAARDLGAPRVATDLSLHDVLGDAPPALKDRVLRTAIRFGKARFAQVAARHAERGTHLPPYVVEAIEWLRGA